MFLVLWEFDVKPGFESRAEKVYGPDGDWANFFAATRITARLGSCATLCVPARMCRSIFGTPGMPASIFGNKIEKPAWRSCEAMTLREKHLGSFDEVS